LGKLLHLSSKAPGVKMVTDFLREQGAKQVDKILTRAVFDPDFAKSLLDAYRGKLSDFEFHSVVNGKIVSLADYKKARLNKIGAGMLAAGGGQ
jgi:hypothetical protein